MDGLKDFVEAIECLVERGQDPRRAYPADGAPGGKFLLRQADGGWAEVVEPAAPRRAVFCDLGDLARAIKRFGTGSCSVFVGEAEILAVLDEDDRRQDVLSFPLTRTVAYEQLMQLSARGPRNYMTHAVLIRVLRLEFPNAIDPHVLTQLRSLNVKSSGQGNSKIGVGVEAMGEAVQREIALDGNPVPDELTFSLDVFNEIQPGTPCEVKVVLDVNFPDGGGAPGFLMRPIPQDLADAVRDTLAFAKQWLGEGLNTETDHVYYGSAFGRAGVCGEHIGAD